MLEPLLKAEGSFSPSMHTAYSNLPYLLQSPLRGAACAPNPPAPLVLLPDLASTQGCSLTEGRGEGEEEVHRTNGTQSRAGWTDKQSVLGVPTRGNSGAQASELGRWKIIAGKISGIP